MFSISAPPTSQDCSIFVISSYKKEMIGCDMKISVCSHGEDAWTTRIYTCADLREYSLVINVVSDGEIFYCLHQGGYFSCYTISNRSWKRLPGPEIMEEIYFNLVSDIVSYVIEYERGFFFFCADCFFELKFKLKDGIKLWFDPSLRYWLLESFMTTYREPERAVILVPDKIRFDSCNVGTWAGLFKFTEDGMNFNWCSSRAWPFFSPLVDASNTIAWLEPRWIQPY